jgi:hypothetical protein
LVEREKHLLGFIAMDLSREGGGSFCLFLDLNLRWPLLFVASCLLLAIKAAMQISDERNDDPQESSSSVDVFAYECSSTVNYDQCLKDLQFLCGVQVPFLIIFWMIARLQSPASPCEHTQTISDFEFLKLESETCIDDLF